MSPVQEEAVPRAFGPSLLAVLRPGRAATCPLHALRIKGLSRSFDMLPAFAGTLRHLVLPNLSWTGARGLPNIISHFTILEVHTFPNKM